MELHGRNALVTGASHGLGLAIARALAREGAGVSCVARPGARLDGAVASITEAGGRAIAAPADVTRADEIERAVRATLAGLGGLDIAVLNAGTWEGAPIVETTEEQWDRLLDLNLKGAFLALRAVLPHLVARGSGTVVGIGSLGGFVGQANAAAYAASKWGLRGLLESAALEAQPHGVRVTLVAPHQINSAGRPIAEGAPERPHTLETGEIAATVVHVCKAPPHAAFGVVTLWPIGTSIRSEG